MSDTDHYAEAERLLRGAEAAHSPESWDTFMRAAQVHATLATVRRPMPTSTFAHAETPTYRTIPWPSSDELVERVAEVLYTNAWPDDGDWAEETGRIQDRWRIRARLALDVIGGAGDE